MSLGPAIHVCDVLAKFEGGGIASLIKCLFRNRATVQERVLLAIQFVRNP